MTAERSGTFQRVLVVTHGYPPNQVNGAEVHTHRKVRWWREHGHDVQVLAADPTIADIPFDEIEELDERFEGIPVRRIRLAVPDSTRTVQETYRNPRLVSLVDRQIREFRPDLIYQVSGYIFGTIPLELAADSAIPSVLFATDFWHVCPRITLLRPDGICCGGPRHPADCAACRLADRRPAQEFGQAANRIIWRTAAKLGHTVPGWPNVDAFSSRQEDVIRSLRRVSLVISNSEFLASWIRRLGVEEDRLHLCRQGIDRSEFANFSHNDNRPSHRQLQVLYLGQLSRHKGIDLLVDAVHALHGEGYDLALRAYGQMTDDDSFLERVSSQVDGDRVQVSAPVPRRELRRILAQSDVLVVPSRWYDISPNVILEALAMGVPVIGSGHGGIADMIRHNVDGLLFKPGSMDSLKNAIRRILTEPDLLDTLRHGIQPPIGLEEEMRIEDEAIERALQAIASKRPVLHSYAT